MDKLERDMCGWEVCALSCMCEYGPQSRRGRRLVFSFSLLQASERKLEQ